MKETETPASAPEAETISAAPETPAPASETPVKTEAETPAVPEALPPEITAPETSAETAPVVTAEKAEAPVPPEPEKPAETAPVQEAPRQRKGGFGGLVLGGVVAALIGAGATVWALPNLPPSLRASLLPPQQDNTLAEAVAAQKARIDKLATDLATVRATQSATSPAPAPDLSGFQAAMDENAASLRTVQDTLKTMQDRLSAVETRPVAAAPAATSPAPAPAAGATPAEMQALEAEIATLRTQIAALSPDAIEAQIKAVAADSETRIMQGESKIADLRKEAETAVKSTIAQSAVARLAAAFDAGAPLAPAIAEAEAAGVSVPAALTGQVPTLSSLQISFPAAARDALAASRRALARGSIGDRIGAFLLTQTGARSVAPREGEGPDAVLSRAQAAVDAGDLKRAVTEISALPDAGQKAMAGWTALAQARLAAGDAIASLSQPAQ